MFSIRCYNKANGTFPSGTLPLMHRVAPCQQDGLEMVPLGRVSPQCHARPTSATASTEHGDDTGQQQQQVEEQREPSPSSQHSCCLLGKSDSRAPDVDSGEPSSSPFLSSSSALRKMRPKGRTLL